jgi:excisionase family DNA binding protein
MNLTWIETQEFKKVLESIERIKAQVDFIKNSLPDYNRWLTPDEACSLLKVSKRTLQTYRDKGLLNFSKVQGRVFIKVSDIEKMLERNYFNSEDQK